MEIWTAEEIKDFNKKCDELKETIMKSFESFCKGVEIAVDKHNKNVEKQNKIQQKRRENENTH